MKITFNKKIAIIVSIPLVIFLFVLVRNSINRDDLDCVVVDEQNDNIAISYFSGDYAIVKVYDSCGNELFVRGLYDNGGGIHEMYFDEKNQLHVILGRKNAELVYDQSGEKISDSKAEDTSYYDIWETWEKKGSSYSKKGHRVTFKYDYTNVFELFCNRPSELYLLTENNETILIWTSSKKITP